MVPKLPIICFVIFVPIPSATATPIAVAITLSTAQDLAFHTSEVKHTVLLLRVCKAFARNRSCVLRLCR